MKSFCVAPTGAARFVPPQWKIDDFWVVGFAPVSTALSPSSCLPLFMLCSLSFCSLALLTLLNINEKLCCQCNVSKFNFQASTSIISRPAAHGLNMDCNS